MKLSWIKYKTKGKYNYSLVLLLGIQDNNIYLLKANSFTKDEIEITKKSSKEITELSLHGKLAWMKNNCPKAYKYGFRKINYKDMIKITEYDLK